MTIVNGASSTRSDSGRNATRIERFVNSTKMQRTRITVSPADVEPSGENFRLAFRGNERLCGTHRATSKMSSRVLLSACPTRIRARALAKYESAKVARARFGLTFVSLTP